MIVFIRVRRWIDAKELIKEEQTLKKCETQNYELKKELAVKKKFVFSV